MNDPVYNYELSSVKMSFVGLDEDMKKFCDNVLETVSGKEVCEYNYVFNSKCNLIKNPENGIELANGLYEIKNDICFVRFRNGNKAWWDLANGYFHTEGEMRYSNLRNWYFLNVIDPFSLSCTKENKMVVHGSLWSNNGIGTVVCGKSGDGKSTISFLMRNDVKVICDDCLVLTKEMERIYAEPVHSGFGLSKGVIKAQEALCVDSNILAKTPNKFYLKSIYGVEVITEKIQVKNILFLSKGTSSKTFIRKLTKSEALMIFLNLQTNLPTLYFKDKYLLSKYIVERCDAFLVEYDEYCDIGAIQNMMQRISK